MKAERVQFWQRVVDASRSLASRIYDFFAALEVVAGGIKQAVRYYLTRRR